LVISGADSSSLFNLRNERSVCIAKAFLGNRVGKNTLAEGRISMEKDVRAFHCSMDCLIVFMIRRKKLSCSRFSLVSCATLHEYLKCRGSSTWFVGLEGTLQASCQCHCYSGCQHLGSAQVSTWTLLDLQSLSILEFPLQPRFLCSKRDNDPSERRP
jgi:hypothetical protein